jgi:uncharacterized protein YebE (UPF0316 family)
MEYKMIGGNIMFGLEGVWLYLFIFLAKVVEVSLGTLRIIFSSKNQKFISMVIGLIEITLWVYIASDVLSGFKLDPYKGYMYILGFAVGIWVGGLLNDYIPVGNIKVNAIINGKYGEELAEIIRNNGFAVTTFDGEGRDSEKKLLIMIVKKKRLKELVKILKIYDHNVVIYYNDTNPTNSMFGVLKK